MGSARRNSLITYLLSLLGMALTVLVLASLRGQLNQTTVALALLVLVLFTATLGGSRPALVNALIGALCFNYFFLPPYGTLTIADPMNWVALAAFLVTAVTVGWLSAAVKRRAEEAEAGRAEIKGLYEELQASFQLASRAEALRQSERLKSALLDAVTHDIRTPLTSIKASVTTLIEEQRADSIDAPPVALDQETRREMLEVINEEADRLNHFIEGLIELARIESGEMRLRRKWSSLDEIITTTLERAAPLTRQHEILRSIEAELPALRVDSRAVSEVLYTLLDNAAKFAPAGTVIRIGARRFKDDLVVVNVDDEGQGISPDMRERVFEKFFRATRDGDESISHQPVGTGMGLAIAKGIVEAHEGKICVKDSMHGSGARFEFTLPVGDDEEVMSGHEAAPNLPVQESLT